MVHPLEFGGLPHAMAYGKKMRSYNQEGKWLSKCYWAFIEDIDDGLPMKSHSHVGIKSFPQGNHAQ